MIGSTSELAFEFEWRAEPEELRGLAWGSLVLWVGGRRLWGTADEPVEWTWIDLVDYLGRAWKFLRFEEHAPFGLVADAPDKLRSKTLLSSVKGRASHEVEAVVHRYQHRHNLAAALSGAYAPALWMMREGTSMRLHAERRDTILPLERVLHTLERVVDVILARCKDAGHDREAVARRRWECRHATPQEALVLRTGLTPEQLESWAPGRDVAAWGDPTQARETTLMAAARLSTPLPEPTRRSLLECLWAAPVARTPALDETSRRARPVLLALAGQRDYEQGYALATWLRAELGFTEGRVDPRQVLSDWGVHIADLPELDPRLDAVACWGPEHGPAVLLNPGGRHMQSPGAQRATLAHELAHLLVDRDSNLPAAEVFGGSTPLHLERRARAFAAEFLLPRTVAADALVERQHEGVDAVVDHLVATFGVSREVAAWQILNGHGRARLDRTETLQLERLGRRAR